jgi:hypothetical protein
MANTTKAQAIELVTEALTAGHILKSDCPRGHITCGPIHEATYPRRFGCILYSYRCRSGEEIGWCGSRPHDAASTFVEYCGRGAAGRAAHAALGRC